MQKCFIKSIMVIGCSVLKVVLRLFTTSWWNAGTRTQWRDQPLKHCNGNWKTSSPCRIQNIKKLLHTDVNTGWLVHHPYIIQMLGTLAYLNWHKIYVKYSEYWKLLIIIWDEQIENIYRPKLKFDFNFF